MTRFTLPPNVALTASLKAHDRGIAAAREVLRASPRNRFGRHTDRALDRALDAYHKHTECAELPRTSGHAILNEIFDAG